MGLLVPYSTSSAGTQPSPPTLPTFEKKEPPYFGFIVPEDASHRPEDTRGWYAQFFEQLYLVIHQDQESLIAFVPTRKLVYHGLPPVVDDKRASAIVTHTEGIYRLLHDESNIGSDPIINISQKRIVRWVDCTQRELGFLRLKNGEDTWVQPR